MSISGNGTTQNNPNYLGVLFEVGQNATPFLNMVGGTNGARPVSGVNFALNTNYVLDTAAQPTISEDASVSGATASTFAQTQDENAIQIFQRVAEVSYANASDISTLGGVPNWAGNQNVTDKESAQIERNLRQMAKDLEYTMFNGSYTKWTASNTASGTRGVSTAISTNSVDASLGALDKAMFNSLTKSMADNGAELDNGQCAIMVNSGYKQALSDLFVLQERSFDIGVQYAPQVSATEILIVDVSKCSLAVLPTMGEALYIEELAKDGASSKTQIYGQFGMDYGHEVFHGKITNLPAV
jgi:hypothetical protein